MRFVPTSVHGVLDYMVGIVLILAPWLLGFADGSAAQWIPILVGAAILVQSALTRYELGLIPLLEMRIHLAIDVLLGAFLAVSPWLFMFADRVWIPHVVLGAISVVLALISEPYPRSLVAPISWNQRTSVGA